MPETALVVAAAVLQLAGLVGCVLPALAGPPLNFIGLIVLCLAKGWRTFSPVFLVVMGALTALTMITDYYLPMAGSKRYGSTKRGFWGALIGMIVGTIAFPPFGLVIGAFLGAILGEVTAGKNGSEAMRAGWGAFLGVLAAMVFRLSVSGLMTIALIIKIL